MILKSLAQFVMRGLPQAVLAAVGFSIAALFLAPVGILSGAIIALVVLRVGLQQALFVTLFSALALGAVTASMGQGLWLGLGSGLIQWLPLLGLAVVLRVSSSWTLTLQVGMVASLLVLVVVYLLLPNQEAWWLSLLDEYLRPALEKMESQGPTLDDQLRAIARSLSGLLTAAVLLSSVVTLMLGRAMQAALYNPGGFAAEFQELRLGQWPALLAVTLIFLALLVASPLTMSLATVAAVVFLLQGFAVVHALVKRRGWPKAVLVAMYVFLIVFLAPMVMSIAGLGLVDSFADFRRRATD